MDCEKKHYSKLIDDQKLDGKSPNDNDIQCCPLTETEEECWNEPTNPLLIADYSRYKNTDKFTIFNRCLLNETLLDSSNYKLNGKAWHTNFIEVRKDEDSFEKLGSQHYTNVKCSSEKVILNENETCQDKCKSTENCNLYHKKNKDCYLHTYTNIQ